MKNQVAVHEAQNSDKVVKFINQDSLKEEVSNIIENGSLQGLYYDVNGNLVAEDIWGDVYENIIKEELTLTEKVRSEAEKYGIEDFEVVDEISIRINGREKYQVVPEKYAVEVLDNFRNYDGFPAHSFDFEGETYYFVLQ